MAADFNKPVTTDSYSNVLAEVRDNDAALALGLDPATTTPANVPTNAIRWTSASNKWQKFDGTAWVDLTATYAISISGNAATATTASATPWSGVTGKPTTLTGYGIADGVPLAGGVAMTGLFSLSGNATSALHPVPKQQMESAVAGVLPSQAGNSGKYLKTDGSNVSWQDGQVTSGFQVFTANGTFTVPAGITQLIVSCVSGGGGGGGGSSGVGSVTLSGGIGGGGGAARLRKFILGVTPGQQFTVTLGAGGSGGAGGAGTGSGQNPGSAGGSGTATTFGANSSGPGIAGGGGPTSTSGASLGTTGASGSGEYGVPGSGGAGSEPNGLTGGNATNYGSGGGGGGGGRSGNGGSSGSGGTGGSGSAGVCVVQW